jgi:NADH dehydrogenase
MGSMPFQQPASLCIGVPLTYFVKRLARIKTGGPIHATGNPFKEAGMAAADIIEAQKTAPVAREYHLKRREEGLQEIVIVGGGAAGLELATRLGKTIGKKKRANITLVAGSMNPSEEELNYLAQAHWRNFDYRFGEMTGLDRAQKRVHLSATFDDEGRMITPLRSIPYDTLIMAVGSVTNDFGTKGVAEFAIPLETAEQAVRFNRRLINACIRAQTQEEALRPDQLHVAIIGAGATGTELAAELHRTAREVVAHGLDRINPDKDIKIVLIEAAARILPALPEAVSDAALNLLRDIGVDVRTSAPVTEVSEAGVRLSDGDFIPAELVVWSAGVKAPDFLKNLDGLETNKINQLAVTLTLQTTRDPDIFAIGDCAECPRPGFPGPVPPRAQAAHQQASHLVRQLRRKLDGKPLEPFTYKDFGSLVSFGKYSTVGSLMGFLVGRSLFIEGYFARIMYRSRSVARRLSRSSEPPVKLH